MTLLEEALRIPHDGYPLEGVWLYGTSLPSRVTVGGFPFAIARWKQKCPGVVAQYRELCRHGSRHLKVYKTMHPAVFGWSIDHEDRFNPDMGKPLAHFFNDYQPGRTAKPAVMAGASWGLGKLFLPG